MARSSSCLRNPRGCANFDIKIVRLASKYLKCFGFCRIAKAGLSAFLALQLLVVLGLAACPALHHALHHDSDKADHDCLITAFVKGQLSEALVVPVVIFFATFVICALRLPGTLPRLPYEYRFAPSRAPPCS